ncbi:ubiquinone biosynthesis O-methyltransferase [Lachnospiraceae bacterium]|nr:ubiquinone biosynthesis O-methyltransferase [Lachnospiraceae bacterium]
METKIFLTIYQNMEALQLNLNYLRTISGISNEDIIIIDMGFDSHIRAWAMGQNDYNYICAEKLENYACIMNTAIKEFSSTENIMVLNGNILCLGNCIQKLEEISNSQENIGAVIPVDYAAAFPQKTDLLKVLETPIDTAFEPKVQTAMKLPYQCVFFARKFIDQIGPMDEALSLPDTVMLDYSFRGLSQKWNFVYAQNIFTYEITPSVNYYAAFLTENQDNNTLREKWGMNYFNTAPNENLVHAIQRQRDEAFTVLEIGCDCGANLVRIKNLFPKARLYGVEINPTSAAIASGFCQVLSANVEECCLPYSGQSFDYILFGDILEHLRDPEKVVGYCRHLLKHGGKIVASIPNLMHYTVLKSLLNGDFTYQDMGLLDRTHIHFFTYNEIVRMFNRAGYEITFCTYTSVPNMPEEDSRFVEQLKQIGSSESFFYLAFQYLVVAKPKGQ